VGETRDGTGPSRISGDGWGDSGVPAAVVFLQLGLGETSGVEQKICVTGRTRGMRGQMSFGRRGISGTNARRATKTCNC
jgi:hypothetical protein